jgi:hypothetical protein
MITNWYKTARRVSSSILRERMLERMHGTDEGRLSRNVSVANKQRMMELFGEPEGGYDSKHPLLWTPASGGDSHDMNKFIWHPKTGEMHIRSGPGLHARFFGKAGYQGAGKGSMDEWLRGFYFPGNNTIATRHYMSKSDFPDGHYGQEANKKSQEVSEHFFDLMRRRLGDHAEGMNFVPHVDNQSLSRVSGLERSRW